MSPVTFEAVAALKPALPLLATLLAFEAGRLLQRRTGGHALANPVLIAVLLVAPLLIVLRIPAADYLAEVQPLPLLLGPATVALSLPLFRTLPQIRAAWLPIAATVAAGAVIATGLAVGIALLLGAPGFVVRAMATKSVTAAVAMAVAVQIGGDPSLAAGIAVLTGILGACLCVAILDACGVRDPRARGLATGIAAHGIGTARMLTLDPVAGAFASLAMGLTGLALGTILPIGLAWLR